MIQAKIIDTRLHKESEEHQLFTLFVFFSYIPLSLPFSYFRYLVNPGGLTFPPPNPGGRALPPPKEGGPNEGGLAGIGGRGGRGGNGLYAGGGAYVGA